LYANLSKDPIRKEIKEYQDFLQQLQKPWWTTRKENPLRVTSANRTTRIKHDVTDATFLEKQRKDGVKDPVGWSEFLNKYAISPVPPSNAPGSDFAGQEFTFEWEEEFPYTGEYVFRAQADNLGRFYLDNQKLLETSEFRQDQTPKLAKRTVTAGVHRIRIDLYNEPIYEVVTTQPLPPPPPPQQPFNLKTTYSGVRDVPFTFRAGIYKIYVGYKQDVGPTGLAIEVKNKTNGKVVFDSLQSINGANIKLIPVTSGRFSPEQFSKNSKESQNFLKRSGVFPENVKDNSTTNIEWTNVQLSEDGDYLISVSVDDSVDMTISLVNALSTAAPPPPPAPKSQPSTQTTGSQTRKIFNTIDYINKANRPLWRTNVYGRGGFINEYGVCPFDTTIQLEDNPYAGVHTIVWDNISFPIDGNYTIEIEVDDNVALTFSGQSGDTVISKRGFSVGDRSTGKTTETRFFKAGTYKITADLEQIPGGKFGFSNIKDINPMALAVNVELTFTERRVVSAKSWNENPMGVTLTIDAPLPPIPQEPIPLQEGRCPRNPMWTTRFPGARESWWPVNFTNKDPKGPTWSAFTNRFAISPIPPLSTPGSDSGGIVYRNSWNIDFPYDGFYALKATVDNGGRILIDDKEIIRGGGVSFKTKTGGVRGIEPFGVENPKATKLFLTKGLHKIEVEVENQKTETFKKIDKKIFDTKDWLFKTKVVETQVQTPTPVGDEWVRIADELVDPTYNSVTSGRGGSLRVVTGGTFHRYDLGTWFRNRRIRQGGDWNDTNPNTNYIENPFNPSQRLTLGTYRPSTLRTTRSGVSGQEELFAIAVWERKTTQSTTTTTTTTKTTVLNQSPTIDGVTYSGPVLATYRDGPLGPNLTPAFNGDDDYRANNMGRSWKSVWSNVDFPENGQYELKAEADDEVIVRVDGVEVGRAKVFEGVRTFTFNATKGKKTLELEFRNIPGNNTSTFATNPVVFSVIITKKTDTATGASKSWIQNPMGISAILIPPPCPRVIKGKGVVTRVDVDDPGNSFPPPAGPGYPVALRLESVKVLDPGINHNCGVDKIEITPSNGAVLDYDCDSFGRIRSVKVLNPGLGFVGYPDIRMVTDTGINATFAPQFEVVRDPIVVDPQKLIQVTDLAGLKQTGYVDGRAYYGAVFLKDGLLFAGFYETPGELVQVYTTLKESIDAQVTTRPSAIQRQGTDITSNDPRLNIPGTPDQII